MFEQPSSSPPPQHIEDIFAEVEPSKINQPSQSVANSAKSESLISGLSGKDMISRHSFKIVVAVVVILIIGGGAFWWFNRSSFMSSEVNNNNNVAPSSDTTESSTSVSSDSSSSLNNQPEPVLSDSDNDGLPDSEEQTLGTNLSQADSDTDGLFDREEVKIYHTNPLVADTDGDTYIDGNEVKNGYDPNGPGKLLKLPVDN